MNRHTGMDTIDQKRLPHSRINLNLKPSTFFHAIHSSDSLGEENLVVSDYSVLRGYSYRMV
jgi:hypothetical protein